MSDVYVIEVGGRAVGLVARDEAGKSYRFHAAVPMAFGLDGRVFATPQEAEDAARKALTAARPSATENLDKAA